MSTLFDIIHVNKKAQFFPIFSHIDAMLFEGTFSKEKAENVYYLSEPRVFHASLMKWRY